MHPGRLDTTAVRLYSVSQSFTQVRIPTLCQQGVLGNRVVFQMDKAKPQDQNLFRHVAERRENPNLDRYDRLSGRRNNKTKISIDI